MPSRELGPRALELLRALVRYAGVDGRDPVTVTGTGAPGRLEVAGLRVRRSTIDALVAGEYVAWRSDDLLVVTALGRIRVRRPATQRADELLQAIARHAPGEGNQLVPVTSLGHGRYEVAGERVNQATIEALAELGYVVWERYVREPTVDLTPLGRIQAQKLTGGAQGGSS